MDLRKFFNFGFPALPPTKIKGTPEPSSESGKGLSQGVFITGQSLMTFPVATFAVTILWKIVEVLVPTLKGALWVPLVISFFIGTFIYWMGISDPKASLSTRDKTIAGGVAVINSAYLFASSAGIMTAVS